MAGTSARKRQPDTPPVIEVMANDMLWCTVCGTTITHKSNKARHLKSVMHAQRLKKNVYHPVVSDGKHRKTMEQSDVHIEPASVGDGWGGHSQSAEPTTRNQPCQPPIGPPGPLMKPPDKAVLAALNRAATGTSSDHVDSPLPAGDPDSDWSASDDDVALTDDGLTVGPRHICAVNNGMAEVVPHPRGQYLGAAGARNFVGVLRRTEQRAGGCGTPLRPPPSCSDGSGQWTLRGWCPQSRRNARRTSGRNEPPQSWVGVQRGPCATPSQRAMVS